jgi:hypothetical protein
MGLEEKVKAREAWITNARAEAKEVWRKQNRELARKRTEALERQRRDALAAHADPHLASGEIGTGQRTGNRYES